MSPDLIFDVGMNAGQDTEFYLAKGFRVVAIDANPDLCQQVATRNRNHILNGRLTILNVGIAKEPADLVFYVNKTSDDWSSFDKSYGQRGGKYEEISVKCRTFSDILAEVGETPYYLKIDIEGHDQVCLDALPGASDLPKFVSVEAGVADFTGQMSSLGYGRFKIISQAWHQWLPHARPAREGQFVDQQMTGHHSGPFGDETYGPWLTEGAFAEEWDNIQEKRYDGSLHQKLGCSKEIYDASWWDFHAALGV